MKPFQYVPEIECPKCEKRGGVYVAKTRAAVELDNAYARCKVHCSYAFSLEELRPILSELAERNKQGEGRRTQTGTDGETLAA